MNCVKCGVTLVDGAVYCHMCGKKQVAAPRKKKKRSNGLGSVTKKSGNRSKPWEAQKAGMYIGCYATKAEAEQAIARLADAKIMDNFNLTFSQIYEKWKPEHRRDISASGMEGYENAYKHCSALYDKAFRKLRTSDFQAVILGMEDKGLSKSSCEKVVQLFGQLSKWAIREEISHTNYAQFVTICAQQKKEKTAFTKEQIQAIQRATSPAADIALILLATGCRPNELFTATVEHCHEYYFISGSKTEAGKNRVIPVSAIGQRAYKKLLSQAQGHALLIDGYRGGNKQYKNFARRDWVDLMTGCGIVGMTPYNCRHTYATLAVQSGVKPEILQKILGHADYNTTIGVYTHLDLDDILKESGKVAVTDTLQTQELAQK